MAKKFLECIQAMTLFVAQPAKDKVNRFTCPGCGRDYYSAERLMRGLMQVSLLRRFCSVAFWPGGFGWATDILSATLAVNYPSHLTRRHDKT